MDVHPQGQDQDDLTNQAKFRKMFIDIRPSVYKGIIKQRLLDITSQQNQNWTLWQSQLNVTTDEYTWFDSFAMYQKNCQEIQQQQHNKDLTYSEDRCRLCYHKCRTLVNQAWNQNANGFRQTFLNCSNCKLMFKENEYRKFTETRLANLSKQQEEKEIKLKIIQDLLTDINTNKKLDWVEYDSWEHDGSTASWGKYYAKYDENCQQLQGEKTECPLCKRDIAAIKNDVHDEEFQTYEQNSIASIANQHLHIKISIIHEYYITQILEPNKSYLFLIKIRSLLDRVNKYFNGQRICQRFLY